ncbi:LysE family translocator [Marinobacter sp.]|uniref:LysE family translocator n=1 Tax=Marinobacter sp. TaxID=50741 RepID=UPI003A91A3A9|tara:strand:+ start:54 stop:725 length:672 start_codon:yes stop_codon:yes gene_type:complete
MQDIGVSVSGLLGLIITSSILIAVPGPSIMLFIGQVIMKGRSHALRGVIGNAIGMLSIAILLSFGLGPLILKSDFALSAIRMLGAIALLLIGIGYLVASKDASPVAAEQPTKRKSPLTAGVIVGITNPKAFIMFGTIVPSFLSGNLASPTNVLLMYSMIPIMLGIAIDSVWVVTAHSVSSRLFANVDSIKIVNRIGGGLIILMALTLAYEGISGLSVIRQTTI